MVGHREDPDESNGREGRGLAWVPRAEQRSRAGTRRTCALTRSRSTYSSQFLIESSRRRRRGGGRSPPAPGGRSVLQGSLNRTEAEKAWARPTQPPVQHPMASPPTRTSRWAIASTRSLVWITRYS